MVDEEGRDVSPGTVGELVIAGPGVMRGYFGQPELTAAAFLVDDEGRRWYRTGDLVVDDGDRLLPVPRPPRPDGQEAADIGSSWARSSRPSIATTGSTARRRRPTDDAGESRSRAFVALKPERKKSIIAMKRHCTTYLPHYMVPDTITFLDSLPATSTDKVDYQRLASLAGRGGSRLVKKRRLRHIWCWKFVFYDVLLPMLRSLGPSRGDRVLGWLGRMALTVQPRRQARLRAALRRAGASLDADWSIRDIWPELAANTARFLARDYPLDRQSDGAVLSRFDVRGYERLRAAMEGGRGAILVGSHLGAHIAGVHWLYRRGVPMRLLVQRPRHVSEEMDRRFDDDGPHPQAEFFLRRDLSPSVAVERLLRARTALRDGLAIYMNGDIPWTGPNTCPVVCWAAITACCQSGPSWPS